MSTKIIKAWINGAIQEIEVEDIISPEQPLSVEERVDILEDKHEVVFTDGNLLVGNGTEELEEMTPEEVLEHINGASVVTMTTEEYEALEEDATNANTLYMLTDSDDRPDWNQNDESAINYIKNKPNLSLDIHSDGLIYIFVDGKPVGSGIAIINGSAVPPDAITLSDGITLTTLMFSDDFDGDTLGSTWKCQVGQNEAAMNCVFSALPKNIGVTDGKLRLTVLADNPTDGYPYSGARVLSQTYGGSDNYNFDTGYAEIRFMVDNLAPGVAPAFWLTGQSQSEEYIINGDYDATRNIKGLSWPWAGEFGPMEGFSDAEGFNCTPGMHYQQDPYISTQILKTVENPYRYIVGEWHTVGVYKSKDSLKFYFDRNLIGTLDIRDNECFSGAGFKIILNLATGSTWGGETPEDFVESNMYVDYVRVYSLSDSMSALTEQTMEALLPEYVNGFSCVANRSWIVRPNFAPNTVNTALYWDSSNTAVAKVENGYVTTVANGECTISATDADGNQIISFPLTVKADAGILATAIKTTTDDTSLAPGETLDIEARIYPTNCDSLTPTLSVVSGSEYCTINGLTIMNTNTSGANQDVIVRVGTNNPNIYKDVTLQMVCSIVDNIDTNGIVVKYTRNGWGETAWASDIDSNPSLTTANNTIDGWVYTTGAGYKKDYACGTAVNIGTDLFNIDGPFTILSRIYYEPGASISSGGNAFEVINDGGTNAGNIEVNAGQNRIYTKDASGTNRQISSFFGETSRDTTNGATYDIAIVKDESRNLTVYINGIQTAQSTHYASVDPMGLTGMALRWPYNSIGVAYYQALLAYDRALTDAEIVTLHTALEEMYA